MEENDELFEDKLPRLMDRDKSQGQSKAKGEGKNLRPMSSLCFNFKLCYVFVLKLVMYLGYLVLNEGMTLEMSGEI